MDISQEDLIFDTEEEGIADYYEGLEDEYMEYERQLEDSRSD